MRNADCGLQIEFLVCNLSFSIRDPKSEIRNYPCSNTAAYFSLLPAAYCPLKALSELALSVVEWVEGLPAVNGTVTFAKTTSARLSKRSPPEAK